MEIITIHIFSPDKRKISYRIDIDNIFEVVFQHYCEKQLVSCQQMKLIYNDKEINIYNTARELNMKNGCKIYSKLKSREEMI